MLRRAVILAVLALAAFAGTAQAEDVIVRYEPGADSSDRARVAGIADPGIKIQGLPYQAFEVGRQDLAQLRADPSVAAVAPNPTYEPFSEGECSVFPVCSRPDDQFFSRQWYLNNDSTTRQPSGADPYPATSRADILAPQGWGLRSSTPARVAIGDTGVNASHPDLAPALAYSESETDAAAGDTQGHGTAVAGVIGAVPGNGIGVAGTAPDARLSMFKVDDSQDIISCAAVANAIVRAVGRADVVNLSLGGPSPCSAMQQAIATAKAADVLVVASAGNDGDTVKQYPAAFPDVVAVAATDPDDSLSSFSSRGADWVDIAAPGSDIATTTNTGGYAYFSGTSFSGPIVAAVAGMLYPLVPDANGDGKKIDDVRQRLLSTTDPIPATGTDVANGRVNLCRALGGDATRCGPGNPDSYSAPSPSPPPPASAPGSPAMVAPGSPAVVAPGSPAVLPRAPAPAPVTSPARRRSLATALRARFGKRIKRLRIRGSKVSFTKAPRSYSGRAARASNGRWRVRLVARSKGSRKTVTYRALLR